MPAGNMNNPPSEGESNDDDGNATTADRVDLQPSSSSSSPTSLSSKKGVYGFHIEQYKGAGSGSYQLISALDPRVHYIGRYLAHDANAKRKTKLNTVEFDWPMVSFALRVKHTASVAIRLKVEGNYFNVFINSRFSRILKATRKAACFEVAVNLDPNQEHEVKITKRTEPQVRGVVSTFEVCTFYGFIVDMEATVLPLSSHQRRKRRIEFIGDSDTCAFGNEGVVTSSWNFLVIKGRTENVSNGFPGILADMFDAEAHVLAWSGKGIHSNALDGGPTMAQLWKRTLASRKSDWEMNASQWMPDLVIVHLGGNDLVPPSSSKTAIIEAYTRLLQDIRLLRPQAHIMCLVCEEGCITSEDTVKNRIRVSLRLQEITEVAMSRVQKLDDRLHYCFIKIEGGLDASDYANMMHYSVTGHEKFANVLAEEVTDKVGWTRVRESNPMPYPPDKKKILKPSVERVNCTIS